MNRLWQMLDGELGYDSVFTPESVVLSLLLAFVLGQVLAWVYYGTHSGLSYSRSFVQALVLITVVVSLVMTVIGNSIITAFGLMGALAIVRFRNMLKDTRDMSFIFCALVIGMAAGSQRYATAIVGAVMLCSIVIYLRLVSFGAHPSQNAFLRFDFSGAVGPECPLPSILKRYCSSYSLVSTQRNDDSNWAEFAYQLSLRDHRRNDELVGALGEVAGLGNVSLVMQEELLEV